MILTLMSIVFVAVIDSFQTDVYLAEHKQLVEDWEAQPYVDIEIFGKE